MHINIYIYIFHTKEPDSEVIHYRIFSITLSNHMNIQLYTVHLSKSSGANAALTCVCVLLDSESHVAPSAAIT